jgi:glycosyltransferase involved in cell wall biosynthesis
MLTFIIPTIGRDTLHRTIESLEKQANNNWNAIVIFDGCNPTIETKNDKIKISLRYDPQIRRMTSIVIMKI